jgi:hypothetical protein
MRAFWFLTLLLVAKSGFLSAQNYADESVLNTGNWYKLGIVETGVYKLDQAFLNSLGLNTAGIDPRNIQIYGNGGGMLPQPNASHRHDDLQENAIYVAGEADGSFDAGDEVWFYAEGPHAWKYDPNADTYRHEYHLYADTNYYYVRVGSIPGKRIESKAASGPATYNSSASRNLLFHEIDSENLIHSGRFWLGEKFDLTLSRTFGFPVPDVRADGEIRLTVQLSARSDVNTKFNVLVGTTLLSSVSINSVNYDNTESLYYRTRRSTMVIDPALVNGDSLRVEIQYEKSGSVRSEGWLDWIEVDYDQSMGLDNAPQRPFHLTEGVGVGEVVGFNLQGGSDQFQVWNVSDPQNAFSIPYNRVGMNLELTADADSALKLVAVRDAELVPVSAEPFNNQNLHGLPLVDYLIISYPGFLTQANRLADFHRNHYQRSVAVVTPDEIYQEFSSGKQDVTAIRDFIRMFYVRSGGMSPGFVLLFGDGTYNPKKVNLPPGVGELNFVPTYQSCNSWNPTESYVSDDFFGLMEEHEGNWGEGCGRDGDDAIEVNTIDVALGRLPVISEQEATDMVDKIIDYATNPDGTGYGSWRKRVLLVADHKEGEGSTHVRQADGYTSIINNADHCINVDKLYMDNYPLVITAGKSRFPEGREALLSALDQGSLIVNYTGHGGEFAWSNSRILENSDINNMQNTHRLPAVVTATCEFGRYDNPDLRSGAELMVIRPGAGAIALFTTVRLVYSSPNETLNRNFYRQVFTFDSTRNRMPSLGEIMMRTKNATFIRGNLSNINSRNFTLLGDPGLILNYPKLDVKVTEINNEPVQEGAVDSLQSLGKVSIRGEVVDGLGQKVDYSGELDVTVFDKPSRFVTRLSNFSFFWQKNRLFNGKATVTNGEFYFEFVVPIDISYEDGLGKISLYFHNDEVDGTGCYDELHIGGTDPNAVPDNEGPQIELFINDEYWRDGGITGASPYLFAKVFDESGINTAGTGIGHEITSWLEEDQESVFILNDYYQAEPNSYQRGTVRYQLEDLSEGLHTLKIRVWDVANNFAEDETHFFVTTNPAVALDEVLNYPNPVEDMTTFLINHNLDGKELNVRIEILSLTGQVVKVLENEFVATGNVYRGLQWDGKTEAGNPLSNGMYVYRVLLTEQETGLQVEASNRLVLLR